MRETDDIPFLRRKLQKLIEQEEYERCASINKWIKELEQESYNKQERYVKKVIESCKTDEQKRIAASWAFEWVKRMKANFPNIVTDTEEVFFKLLNL